MAVIGIDIHEKVTLSSVKERQEQDVMVVDYISSQTKPESRETRVNKSHNSRNVLRVPRNSDHLGPVRVNRSTYYLVSFQRDSRGSIANKVPGRFLDKENIIIVLLRLKKSIKQRIVLANILRINA